MAGEIDQLLVRIDADSARFRREVQRADRQISSFEQSANRNLGNVETRFQRFGAGIGRSLGALGIGLGAATLGREVLGTITQFEALDQRIRTLTGTTEAYNEAQRYLQETSNRLATDIAATTDQYGRLLTLQNSGLITNEQARALLEGFADAAAATGAETAQLNQVMYGLSQALSSGTVRAEEFNQVTEPMPGLLQAMERAAGLSAGGLRQLVNEGKITSEMFGQIMVAALQEFAGEAEKRADTIGGKWQILNNQWVNLQRTLSEPVTDVLAPLLETATQLIDKMGPLIGYLVEVNRVASQFTHLPFRALGAAGEAVGLLDVTPAEQRERLFERRDILEAQLAEARAMPADAMEGLGGLENYIARISEELATVQGQIDALSPNVNVSRGNAPPPPLPPPGGGRGSGRARGGRRGPTDAERAAQREAAAIAGVTSALQFEEEQLRRTSREQEIYAQLRAAGIDENHEAAAAIMELAGRTYDLQAASDALNEAIGDDPAFGFAADEIKETTDAVGGLSEAVLGGLQHALVSTGGRFKDLESVAVAAISHIITELIRMQSIASAAGKSGPLEGIFGAIGGLFGGFGGGGSIGPTVAGAAAAGIPGGGFAMGGRPPVGIPSLVGERGPEIFVPDVAGTVVPNFAIRSGERGASTVSPVFHVNVVGARGNAEIEQMVYAGIARAKPEIVAESGRYVQNSRALDPRFLEKGAG